MDERDEVPAAGDDGVTPAAGGARPGVDGPVSGPAPTEQRKRRRWMKRRTKRGLLAIGGGIAGLMVVVFAVLWFRCGVRGCPDVEMLRGYMPDEASVVLDRDGEEVSKLFVTRRFVVPVDSMQEHTLNAFIAMEDKRFWDHGGVDWRRVFGAAASNVQAGGIAEGSSTITMQLARNVFPDQLPANERTLWRKLGEARVARQIEGEYSKREILELYLNQIYFGSGAYGLQSAAEEYFGKSATQLTLGESAMLAALPRAPSRLNPRANSEAALEGRSLVLRQMAQQGLITEAERAEADDERLVLRERHTEEDEVAPYFVEAVRRQLEDELGNAVYTQGYTIHTTLDLDAQRAAEEQLTAQLTALEGGRYGSYPHTTYNGFHADSTRDPADGTPYLQGAVVIMQARTGDVLALVGGRDYDDSEFNRATQAKRQPGSAFKPFVYAAAVNAGYSPAHRLMDRPLRYVMDDGRVWEPGNYDGSFAGAVSMRQALTQSRNVPTVRLANEVGISRVLGMAEQMGLGRMPSNPSVVLGTAEVTPLQLTAAYAGFATLGQRPEPRLVTRVVDRDGDVVWQQQPQARQVIDPAVAFVTTSMLQDVVDRGTGSGVRGAGFRGAAAGKTGTTQDAADVWFVGFTPEIVGTIWIGLDKRQRILRTATGGELAAPLWGRIMRSAGLGGDAAWTPPAGVEQRSVDEFGGAVADGCAPTGVTYQEYFIRGTAMSVNCYPDAYAYNDTLGYDQYGYGDAWADSALAASAAADADADGWWARMRERVLGRDSMGQTPVVAEPQPGDPRPGSPVAPIEPITPIDPDRPVASPPAGTPPAGTPPAGTPPAGTPPARPTPATRDTVRPPPAGAPLGRPVTPDSTRRPPPDGGVQR